MKDRKYVVIRTDDDIKEWIWKELKDGKLRQGWGGPGTQLMENGKPVEENNWKDRYKASALEYWDYSAEDHEIKKRYRILLPMVGLEQGDIVVIPKMPSYDKFVITVVDKGYEFDYKPVEKREEKGYRHLVQVDKTNIKIFSYSSSLEARTILKKMRAYQSAVNSVWDKDFINAVDKLLQKEGDTSIKDTTELFREIKAPILKELLNNLRKLRWSDLENLVTRIFEKAGYNLYGTHQYDRKGGDADIIFTRIMPLISDYEGIDLKIYIQVKQKYEIDQEDIYGVEQLIKISEGDVSSIKVLASTADDFTDKCKIHAKEYNVILIPGEKLADMIMSNLK